MVWMRRAVRPVVERSQAVFWRVEPSMARETTLMNGIVRDLLDYRVYKASQGRRTRQFTCVALWVIIAYGAWRMSRTFVEMGPVGQYVEPTALLAADQLDKLLGVGSKFGIGHGNRSLL